MKADTYREYLTDLQLEVEELRAKLKEAQTGDMISRQAAIDLVKSRSYDLSEREDEWAMVQDVEELPSAQPEIIRCKECKYYGYNECFHGRGLTVAFDNTFCSYAERRTDEL